MNQIRDGVGGSQPADPGKTVALGTQLQRGPLIPGRAHCATTSRVFCP